MTVPNRWRIAGVLIVLAGLAPSAAAQDKVDIGVGYQYQRLDTSGEGTNMPVGLNFDVTAKIVSHLSAIAQVDWSRRAETVSGPGVTAQATANVTTFGAGIRLSSHANPNVTPFVQALFGSTHVMGSVSTTGLGEFSASETDTMVQVGGGVGFPLSGSLGGVAQFDYRRIFAADQGVNSFRGVFGIRWMIK